MKEFLSYLKPYRRDTILAILCIEAETVFELVIPLVMASIVDVGVAAERDRCYNADNAGAARICSSFAALRRGSGTKNPA